ncbi:MAG: EF-hand domain-containing protein, partial [Planctomycetes bacterium]|nr:EF-hand domain-containing protein [Planctomycetota bacterium]
DGYLDRNEIRQARWYDDPYAYDRNRDGRLSRTELAYRYAQRRAREAAARSGNSSGNNSRSAPHPQLTEEQRREQARRAAEEERRRRGQGDGARASLYLAETLMRRHDVNNDGQLDATERRNMGVESTAADTNRDFHISRQELADWLAQLEANQNRVVPRELPAWFVERDTDKDGQISMKEFASEWTDDKVDEFIALDTNNDGFIVSAECLKSLERSLEQHANHHFQVIPTKGVIRSEIEVEETALIADVDVMISITHTHDDHLNVYLIGPEGQRVELFTGVGGNDDHFDNTILDEEAPTPIVRGRPPFAGRYQTEELVKGRPGLKQFYEHSMAGTWSLLIEANSDRPGALHSWALIFRKAGEEAGPALDQEFD